MPDLGHPDISPAPRNGVAPDQASRHTRALEFDEEAYLSVYADVTVSLDLGEFATAREHFDCHGRREGRLTDETYIRALGLAGTGPLAVAGITVSVDTIVGCRSGTVLVVGWADDRGSPLASLSLFAGHDRAWNTTAFGRVRRPDVEAALQAASGHLFGFWAVATLGGEVAASDTWTVRGRLADGRFGQAEARLRLVGEPDLRTTILGYFATTECYGNRDIESYLSLEAGVGAGLVELNRKITAAVVAGAWVSYYGPARPRYRGSVIVCLYGKPEFLFLQAALFSRAAGAAEYEFVYVCNSPELTEILAKEARIAARIYGLSIVLVCLPDNAGFGAANNLAARFARSDRLLITNPDVFPRDDDWAQRHARILAAAPAAQTRMFGAPLYYDDGSLMHQGMYFEVDAGVSVRPDGIFATPMIRTEHYAKGAPAWSPQFAAARPVPAITGAFISADRAWFERLGGFNEDYLFGHYEDADLSLKSLAAGSPVWMHDFPLWHMEGKGSVRRPAHEGGILVNRWLFTRQWGTLIAAELRGPAPACAALQPPPPAVAAPRPVPPPPRPRARTEPAHATRRSR